MKKWKNTIFNLTKVTQLLTKPSQKLGTIILSSSPINPTFNCDKGGLLVYHRIPTADIAGKL